MTLSRIALLVATACLIPSAVHGQGRGARGGDAGNGGVSATVSFEAVSLSVDLQTRIRDFYSSRPASNVEGLPPGIRRNLARGKPLPPGIARKSPPAELRSQVHLREGYQLVEVGLDVFLVEVATNVIHDVLMDVIR